MFSFTRRPKCALRTRKAAARSDNASSSGAWRTASASARDRRSSARALSASASQLEVSITAMAGLSPRRSRVVRMTVDRHGVLPDNRAQAVARGAARPPDGELRASEGRGLMGFRVSVDTGGTFTDVVVADEDGKLLLAKAPTDVTRAFQSIEEGLAQLAPDARPDGRASCSPARRSSPTARPGRRTRSSRARRPAPRSSRPRASRTSCCSARAGSSTRSVRTSTRRPTSRAG